MLENLGLEAPEGLEPYGSQQVVCVVLADSQDKHLAVLVNGKPVVLVDYGLMQPASWREAIVEGVMGVVDQWARTPQQGG